MGGEGKVGDGMSFLGSDELRTNVVAARAARDEAQAVLDAELYRLWHDRPDGWGMTQIAELAGTNRAEIVASIGRVEAKLLAAKR